MPTFQTFHCPIVPELHVFEQAGGWHWGITVPRAKGSGFKLIAFSDRIFPTEDAAHADGRRALVGLADSGARNRLAADDARIKSPPTTTKLCLR